MLILYYNVEFIQYVYQQIIIFDIDLKVYFNDSTYAYART